MLIRTFQTTRGFKKARLRLPLLRLLFGLILLLSAGNRLSGQHSELPGEYEIKAAFLYNFAKFVEWPPRALANGGSPIVLGILGEDPFGPDIDRLIRGKTVNGREMVIRRFDTMQGLAGCHILFISSSEKDHLPQILENLKDSNVLTVGDTEQFARLGGIINFILENNKIRFEINTEAAERTELKISSQLLKLARITRTGRKN